MNSRQRKRGAELIVVALLAWSVSSQAEKPTLSSEKMIAGVEFRRRCEQLSCERISVVSEFETKIGVEKSTFFSTKDQVAWSVGKHLGDVAVSLRMSNADARKFSASITGKLPLHLVVLARDVVLSGVIVTGRVDGDFFIGQLDGEPNQRALIKYLESVSQ
jgi:hypothetical protein